MLQRWLELSATRTLNLGQEGFYLYMLYYFHRNFSLGLIKERIIVLCLVALWQLMRIAGWSLLKTGWHGPQGSPMEIK